MSQEGEWGPDILCWPQATQATKDAVASSQNEKISSSFISGIQRSYYILYTEENGSIMQKRMPILPFVSPLFIRGMIWYLH